MALTILLTCGTGLFGCVLGWGMSLSFWKKIRVPFISLVSLANLQSLPGKKSDQHFLSLSLNSFVPFAQFGSKSSAASYSFFLPQQM
jgi:hypothetical protein